MRRNGTTQTLWGYGLGRLGALLPAMLVFGAMTLGPSPRARLLAFPSYPSRSSRPIVIASKPFAESYILAEMFAQLLEAHGWHVDRRLGLGGTAIAYAALRGGSIDVYPEYTGTGLLVILGMRS